MLGKVTHVMTDETGVDVEAGTVCLQIALELQHCLREGSTSKNNQVVLAVYLFNIALGEVIIRVDALSLEAHNLSKFI